MEWLRFGDPSLGNHTDCFNLANLQELVLSEGGEKNRVNPGLAFLASLLRLGDKLTVTAASGDSVRCRSCSVACIA